MSSEAVVQLYLICSSNCGLETSAICGIIATTSGDVWSRSADVPHQKKRAQVAWSGLQWSPPDVSKAFPWSNAEHWDPLRQPGGPGREGSSCSWYGRLRGEVRCSSAGRVLLLAHDLSGGTVGLGIQRRALPFPPEFQAGWMGH